MRRVNVTPEGVRSVPRPVTSIFTFFCFVSDQEYLQGKVTPSLSVTCFPTVRNPSRYYFLVHPFHDLSLSLSGYGQRTTHPTDSSPRLCHRRFVHTLPSLLLSLTSTSPVLHPRTDRVSPLPFVPGVLTSLHLSPSPSVVYFSLCSAPDTP